jgi:protein-tyrosine-phosphatase
VKYIAFVCKENKARSQMAQACFNLMKKIYFPVDSQYEAISWGSNPSIHGINPKIIYPMSLVGIDMTDRIKYFPKGIHSIDVRSKLGSVARVYSMGCDVDCELPEGLAVDGEWGIEDFEWSEQDVVAIRDKILGKTLELIQELFEKDENRPWRWDP